MHRQTNSPPLPLLRCDRPPDDPRRGLIALLGREHAGRRAAYTRFRESWDRYGGDGMRRDLVALSTTPLSGRRDPAHPASET